MITAQDLANLIELAAAAPLRSYAHAKQLDELFTKMVALHQALNTGKAIITIDGPAGPVNGLGDTRGGVVIPAGGAPQAVQAAAVAAAETE
jgi:hypothetical protein